MLNQSVQLTPICCDQQLFRRGRKVREKSTSILCTLLHKTSSIFLWIKPYHKTSFGLLTVSQEPTSSACCVKKCKWNIIQTRKTQFEENVDSTEHISYRVFPALLGAAQETQAVCAVQAHVYASPSLKKACNYFWLQRSTLLPVP